MPLPAGESLSLWKLVYNIWTCAGYRDHKELGKADATKEYSKPPETSHKEMEFQELPDKEFKIIEQCWES